MGDMDEYRGGCGSQSDWGGYEIKTINLGMATLRKSVAVHPKIEYQFCLSSYPPNFN